MKKLRGKHHYKSYQELCEALGITPAPRGERREQQKKEIQETYRMTVQANHSIDLERRDKKEEAHRQKLDSGQIRVIDGREVDLGSNRLYQDTSIADLILYRALTAEGKISTKEGFLLSCFERTRFFRELLTRGGSACAQFSLESLHLAHELVIRRLYAMVNGQLRQFENQGWIRCDRYYLLKGNDEAELEEVRPAVEAALRAMGLRREFQAFTDRERRDRFIHLRNRIFQDMTGKEILCKRFEITPLIPPEHENYLVLTNKDIQIILTCFFDVFREKVCYDIDRARRSRFGKCSSLSRMQRQRHLEACAEEVKEIVQTYCAYVNKPLHDEPTAFYSIQELQDYYENLGTACTALDYTQIPDYEACLSPEALAQLREEMIYEEGDTQLDYDEVNRNGKGDYDYYALSNMTGERLQALREELEAQDAILSSLDEDEDEFPF